MRAGAEEEGGQPPGRSLGFRRLAGLRTVLRKGISALTLKGTSQAQLVEEEPEGYCGEKGEPCKGPGVRRNVADPGELEPVVMVRT